MKINLVYEDDRKHEGIKKKTLEVSGSLLETPKDVWCALMDIVFNNIRLEDGYLLKSIELW